MNQDAPGFVDVTDAATALDDAGTEYWCFGGWAVDLWAGRLTRDHDDIDFLVWRRDEERVDAALTAGGWVHAPTPEDLLGTNYERRGAVLQLTFLAEGPTGATVVPVPEQPIVLSDGPLGFAVRSFGGAGVRVVPLAMLLAGKSNPRPDDSGGAKDRADLEVLRSLTDGDTQGL